MPLIAPAEDRLPRAPWPEWRPAFRGDWAETTFVHFAVEPAALQPFIPFPLDEHEGHAYVSLVAFTMCRMRPAWLDSPLGELLLRPIAPCRFLNVRTYVRAGGESGIYFMGEWLSQWLNIPFGPLLYGLPYHAGRVCLERDNAGGAVKVDVRGRRGTRLAFAGSSDPSAPRRIAEPGSLDEFLLERYLAFTRRRGEPLAFRVEHAPWEWTAADIELEATDLLGETGDWMGSAQLAGGHITPGAFDVGMGAPRALLEAAPASRSWRSAFLA